MKREEIEQQLIENYATGRILDLGCGEGRMVNSLITEGEYFGVDINKASIEIARRNYPKQSFCVNDASSLPFPDDFFDVIFAFFNVIDEIKDIETAIKEITRVLKSGGCFVFSAHNPFYWKQIIKRMLGIEEFSNGIKINYYFKKDFIKLLKEFELFEELSGHHYSHYVFIKIKKRCENGEDT